MKQVKSPIYGLNCRKHGRTNAGSKQWLCNQCKYSFMISPFANVLSFVSKTQESVALAQKVSNNPLFELAKN